MRKLKNVLNKIVDIVGGIGLLLTALTIIYTLLTLIFGAAVWSTHWFWSLI